MAISVPMSPSPTIPTVVPRSSPIPGIFAQSGRAFIWLVRMGSMPISTYTASATARWPWSIFRAHMSINPSACSPTVALRCSAAVPTGTPRSAAAVRSMFRQSVPCFWMNLSEGAARITSPERRAL